MIPCKIIIFKLRRIKEVLIYRVFLTILTIVAENIPKIPATKVVNRLNPITGLQTAFKSVVKLKNENVHFWNLNVTFKSRKN